MGLERLIIKNKKCVGYFLTDQQNDFYQSSTFNKILKSIQKNPKKFYLEEKQIRNNLRLLLVLDQVNSVEMLLDHLGELIDN